MYNPPINEEKTVVRLSIDVLPHIWKVIGKEGRVFKAITRKSEVKYIWYNDEEKAIEIWGERKNLIKAERLLSERINKFTDKNETENQTKKRKFQA